MSILAFEQVTVDDLAPANRRLRRHSKKQLKAIARSIETFGFLDPALIDKNNNIICGVARCEAAKLSGLKTVPAIRVEGLTPEQLRAYAIAENRLGEMSEWDDTLLTDEVAELIKVPGLDVTTTGLATAELDRLLNALEDRDLVPDAPFEMPDQSKPAVTRLGDTWVIGTHRITCQDALVGWSYAALLGNERAGMIFTDPPYNIRIAGFVSRSGHGEFAMASGEMSSEEFIEFIKTFIGHLVTFSVTGSVHYICIDFRHVGDIIAAGKAAYKTLLNVCVWAKTNAGLGSFYRSAHELICVFRCGSAPHVNNVELGKHGRNRTNVWRYRGANSFGKGRAEAIAAHATVKPVDLVADAILDASKRGDIILDPFLGTGTTLVAAERVGRRGYGIEIDPYHVDTALARIGAAVGVEPVHLQTGLTFAQLAAGRASEQEAVR